jgi:hypothetical protein
MAIVYESSEMFIKYEKEKADAAEQAAKRIEEAKKGQEEAIIREKEAIKSLAELDEELRIKKLEGEERKLAQFSANYQKQITEIEALHNTQFEAQAALREMQLSQAENELMTEEEKNTRKSEIEAEYNDRILEMDVEHEERRKAMVEQSEADIKAIKKEAYKEELQNMADIFDVAGKGMEFSKKMLQEDMNGKKKYVLFYKTVAISEALMNATQSILRTMAGTPYPFNIPLVAVQAAAAAIKVNEIKNMYRGGMIPGINTLVMANEQGREAILNPMAVRAIGGEAGVNALNQGAYTNNSYSYDNRQSSSQINIYSTVISKKTLDDEIIPALELRERMR